MSRPASGGGRWVEVAPERLDRWLDGFAQQHGMLTWSSTRDRVDVLAEDGARAEISVPFPPLTHRIDAAEANEPLLDVDGTTFHADKGGALRAALIEHAGAPRRIGVLLVRLGGFAVGVVDGAAVSAGSTGKRPVHGRAAAGGWSQHRFARRREGQARVALHAAADLTVKVLLPEVQSLDAVLTGGDRSAINAVLADQRLAPLRELVAPEVLDVPDPRRAVLDTMPQRVRAIRIRVLDGDERPGEHLSR